MKESHKGYIPSIETKRKIGIKNKIISNETKEKMSNAKKGKKMTEYNKQILLEYHTGRKHTLESKEKMSNAKKGKKLSNEHKNKIKESMKKHKELSKINS